ncbi:MAG TPA: hypothetical protein VGC79_01465 [Polyangiaceae bacterium]
MTCQRTMRLCITGLLALAGVPWANAARAEELSTAPASKPRAERLLAAGVRVGLIPPVFTVAELLVRPAPHVALGVFGMALHERLSIGGELMVELAAPGESSLYAQAAYLYYSNTSEHWQRSQLLYITAGYTWKFALGVELQLGAGALFVLSDETKPCTEGFCLNFETPKVLPTIDLAVRYGFL